jgi:hypothetical protein
MGDEKLELPTRPGVGGLYLWITQRGGFEPRGRELDSGLVFPSPFWSPRQRWAPCPAVTFCILQGPAAAKG